MTPRTPSPFSVHVIDVVLLRPEEQMVGVRARRVVAFMADEKPLWDVSEMNEPRSAMSRDYWAIVVGSNLPVPKTGKRCGPPPTVILSLSLDDLLEVSRFQTSASKTPSEHDVAMTEKSSVVLGAQTTRSRGSNLAPLYPTHNGDGSLLLLRVMILAESAPMHCGFTSDYPASIRCGHLSDLDVVPMTQPITVWNTAAPVDWAQKSVSSNHLTSPLVDMVADPWT